MYVHYYCYCCYRNFTSAHTIRVESGLSGAMEQYDKNFKIRRIIGDELSVKATDTPSKGTETRRGSATPDIRRGSIVMLNKTNK